MRSFSSLALKHKLSVCYNCHKKGWELESNLASAETIALQVQGMSRSLCCHKPAEWALVAECDSQGKVMWHSLAQEKELTDRNFCSHCNPIWAVKPPEWGQQNNISVPLLTPYPFCDSLTTDGAVPLEAADCSEVTMYLIDMCHISLSFTWNIFILIPF